MLDQPANEAQAVTLLDHFTVFYLLSHVAFHMHKSLGLKL